MESILARESEARNLPAYTQNVYHEGKYESADEDRDMLVIVVYKHEVQSDKVKSFKDEEPIILPQ